IYFPFLCNRGGGFHLKIQDPVVIRSRAKAEHSSPFSFRIQFFEICSGSEEITPWRQPRLRETLELPHFTHRGYPSGDKNAKKKCSSPRYQSPGDVSHPARAD